MRELVTQDANIDQIVELLRLDPTLSAQLPRKADSLLYGFASRIDSLQRCLVLLGFSEARKVASTAATASYAGKAFRTPELKRCWLNAIACAELSGGVAAAVGGAEQSYTAGLMHDIGRLGLLVARPEDYAALIREAEVIGPVQDYSFFLDREKEEFGSDHCEAGRWLGEQWNTSVELQVAAGRHHDRSSEDEFGTVEVVHFACALADSLGFAVESNIAERLGADEDALREKIEKRVSAFDGPDGAPSQRIAMRETAQPEDDRITDEIEQSAASSVALLAVAGLLALTVIGILFFQ